MVNQIPTHTTLHIVIVTTAAPPWLTGTAVNPALRASYLSFKGHRVTLLVPFLAPDEQHYIFAPGVSFSTAEQQQRHVQRFLESRTGRPVVGVDVVFYPGRYDKLFCSIIPVGDLTLLVRVCICVWGGLLLLCARLLLLEVWLGVCTHLVYVCTGQGAKSFQ